jgi:hypothetical protein
VHDVVDASQIAQIRPDPLPRLGPAKTACDQLDHRVRRRHPPGTINHPAIITAEPGSASHDHAEVPLQY